MNRYPWPEMQVGEVREITSDKSLSAVRSAACMWCMKQVKSRGERPKFKVTELAKMRDDYKDLTSWMYRVERTA